MHFTWLVVLWTSVAVGGGIVSSGCVSQDYVGERYAPTDHVQVFYDESSVPEDYKVIGQDRAESTEFMSTENIVKAMAKKAKEVGADALLIVGVNAVQVSTTTTTHGSAKHETEYYATTDGKLHTRHAPTNSWQQNSYSTVQKDKVVTAKFLRRSGS